jgi:hypothetical protein
MIRGINSYKLHSANIFGSVITTDPTAGVKRYVPETMRNSGMAEEFPFSQPLYLLLDPFNCDFVPTIQFEVELLLLAIADKVAAWVDTQTVPRTGFVCCVAEVCRRQSYGYVLGGNVDELHLERLPVVDGVAAEDWIVQVRFLLWFDSYDPIFFDFDHIAAGPCIDLCHVWKILRSQQS